MKKKIVMAFIVFLTTVAGIVCAVPDKADAWTGLETIRLEAFGESSYTHGWNHINGCDWDGCDPIYHQPPADQYSDLSWITTVPELVCTYVASATGKTTYMNNHAVGGTTMGFYLPENRQRAKNFSEGIYATAPAVSNVDWLSETCLAESNARTVIIRSGGNDAVLMTRNHLDAYTVAPYTFVTDGALVIDNLRRAGKVVILDEGYMMYSTATANANFAAHAIQFVTWSQMGGVELAGTTARLNIALSWDKLHTNNMSNTTASAATIRTKTATVALDASYKDIACKWGVAAYNRTLTAAELTGWTTYAKAYGLDATANILYAAEGHTYASWTYTLGENLIGDQSQIAAIKANLDVYLADGLGNPYGRNMNFLINYIIEHPTYFPVPEKILKYKTAISMASANNFQRSVTQDLSLVSDSPEQVRFYTEGYVD